jgi:hypothetical protein
MLKHCYRTVVSTALRSFTWGFYPDFRKIECAKTVPLRPAPSVTVFHAAKQVKSQSTTTANNYVKKLSFQVDIM